LQVSGISSGVVGVVDTLDESDDDQEGVGEHGRVTQRYQQRQRRTWCWSRPHSPLLAQALQRLQHHHGADHLARDRRVSATLARQVGEQLRREQLVAWSARKAYTDPSGSK
jgi:hypothetical protein